MPNMDEVVRQVKEHLDNFYDADDIRTVWLRLLIEEREQGELVYEECKNLCILLQNENAEQDKEIQRFKDTLSPSVVYSAIRHYYKQGLFEQEEFGDIENAMDLIGNLIK